MSQDIENQQITSLKCILITLSFRKNDRNSFIGLLFTGASVNALQVCSVALVLLLITS